VTLSLTFDGVKPPSRRAARYPGFDGGYLGQSSQIQIINGRTTSSLAFNYASRPPNRESNPSAVQVRVNARRSPASRSADRRQRRRSPCHRWRSSGSRPQDEAYVGEAMALEIQLYAQGGRLAQLPTQRRRRDRRQDNAGRLHQVQNNGIPYQLVTYQVP